MKNIKDYNLDELQEELINMGEKKFRAEQIFKWGVINLDFVKDNTITEILKLIAPGTKIREGLENILKAIANKKSENRVVVRLDIEDYKQKRVETLEEVARRKASIVERTGKMITLEPMKAYERKIIHSVLQDNPNVETRSIGQEPKRRIVITKK